MSRTLTSNRKADFSPLGREHVQLVLNDPIVRAACDSLEVDIIDFQTFNRVVAMQIIRGVARSGVRIEEICREGHLAQGHVREPFGPRWQIACELIARFLHAPPAGESLLCEVISVNPQAETNHDHKGLGRVYLKGAGNCLKLIRVSVGRPDRNVEVFTMPLTTGMDHDHSDPEADTQKLAEFARALKAPIPGPLHEHMKRVLERRECLRLGAEWLIAHGMLEEKNDKIPISDRFALEQVFARWLIVESFKYGRPKKKHRKWSHLAVPALDDAIVQEFIDARVNAILDAGFDPEPGVSLTERGYQFLDDLEIPLNPPPAWGVEYWHNPDTGMLARAASAKDGRGTIRQLWRIINPDARSPHEAIAAIEHVLEGVPASCLGRHHDDCRPGRLQVSPEYEPDMFAVLDLADAVCVEAERRYRTIPPRRS